jgi:hypothetical protein
VRSSGSSRPSGFATRSVEAARKAGDHRQGMHCAIEFWHHTGACNKPLSLLGKMVLAFWLVLTRTPRHRV